MKLKTPLSFLFLWLILLLTSQKYYSQCFQIESILVDACGAQEGFNEMVRFKVGSSNLNVSNLSVAWATTSLDWQGVIQNTTTQTIVSTLNADIIDAGGCGELIQPTSGILPANATVILVTSYNMDTNLNSFGALTEDTYIIFQNNPDEATGHFANSGTGNRTLTMSFGSCSDTVTYNRASLINPAGATVPADGAIVLFQPAGTATYINNDCSAPVPPFTVNAVQSNLNACAGTTITLNGSAQGQQTTSWTAPNGTFSAPSSLSTNYVIPSNAAGSTIVITFTATNSCNLSITDTVNVIVTPSVVPTFNSITPICAGQALALLPTISNNGVSGSWSPAINNTATTTYTFTPNAGQCATTASLIITVNPANTVPSFSAVAPICAGQALAPLPTTSNNGISGSWSPAINNTTTTTYTFTPNAGQCATTASLTINVSEKIYPLFNIPTTICSGSIFPDLVGVSDNGISGTWNPSEINSSGSYVFTPDNNQCAFSYTLTISVSEFEFVFTEGCKNGVYLIEASPVSNSFDPENVDYQWRNLSGSNIGNNENVLNVSEILNSTSEIEDFPITYELIISTNEGCSESKKIEIFGAFCTIPKGISPNNDGNNDEWDLTGLGVKEVTVFDRYGTKVFHYKNYTNQWKGQSDRGNELPDATYFYVIDQGNGQNLTGWVYLNKAN